MAPRPGSDADRKYAYLSGAETLFMVDPVDLRRTAIIRCRPVLGELDPGHKAWTRPVVRNTPEATAIAGMRYRFIPDIKGIPGEAMPRFRLDNAPRGMKVNPATGEITWTPSRWNVGQRPVTLVVSVDGKSYRLINFVLTVEVR